MKLRHLCIVWAALSAVALGGVALGQNVPAQFVVSGKAAEKLRISRPSIWQQRSALLRRVRRLSPPGAMGSTAS